MQIETIVLTSKKVIFNGISFDNSETAIEFGLSKKVWEWSHILIQSPNWPTARKKRQTLTVNFTICLEKYFFQTTLNIGKLYNVGKYFFVMSMDSRSLSQNKALFGLDVFARICVLTIWALSPAMEGTVLKRRSK